MSADQYTARESTRESTRRESERFTEPPGRVGPPQDGETIAYLLKDLANDMVLLFKQELALARGELVENSQRMARNAKAMAVGAVIALAGGFVLLMALVHGSAVVLAAMGADPEVAVWLGPLLLGIIILGIGVGMLLAAKRRFEKTSLVPKRTVQTVKDDSNWAKQKLHRS
jgi:hypothetical protein